MFSVIGVFFLSLLLEPTQVFGASECPENLNEPTSAVDPMRATGIWKFMSSKEVKKMQEEVLQPNYKTNPIPIPESEITHLALNFARDWHTPWVRLNKTLHEYTQLTAPMGFDVSKYKGKVLIDVGCGLSPAVDELIQLGVTATGFDMFFHEKYGYRDLTKKETAEEYRKQALEKGLNLNHRVGSSLIHLPLSDNSVDGAISILALSGLPSYSYQQALAEILRVLKVGGEAFIINDLDPKSPASEQTELLQKAFRVWGVPLIINPQTPNQIYLRKPEILNIVPIQK